MKQLKECALGDNKIPNLPSKYNKSREYLYEYDEN
jgi:hypothetical protein